MWKGITLLLLLYLLHSQMHEYWFSKLCYRKSPPKKCNLKHFQAVIQDKPFKVGVTSWHWWYTEPASVVKQLVNSSILQAMILCSQKQYLGFGFLIHLVILFHYFICCFTDTHLCVCVCVCTRVCRLWLRVYAWTCGWEEKWESWIIMLLIRNSLLYYSCQSRKTSLLGEAEKCCEETKRIEKLEERQEW